MCVPAALSVDSQYSCALSCALFPFPCTNSLPAGERGIVPAGREGAGRPYHFKGKPFYRIIDGFIDQSGEQAVGDSGPCQGWQVELVVLPVCVIQAHCDCHITVVAG